MFNQCSYCIQLSSFNLAILIGFNSRLCSDKRVYKTSTHFTNIYSTLEQTLKEIL